MLSARPLAILLALLLLPRAGVAHDKPGPDETGKDRDFTLPTDRKATLLMEQAKGYIAARDWESAVAALQRLNDRDEDCFLPVIGKIPDGRPIRSFISVRLEAQRLLAELPGVGRQAYQERYGRLAADLLADARQEKDVALMARIASRYPLTNAGIEALQELAGRYADRGEFLLAAANYDHLARRDRLRQWPTGTLIQAAYAYRGDGRPSAAVEKELFDRVGDTGLRVSDRILTAEQLKDALEQANKRPSADGWPMFGGDVTRSATAADGMPNLERLEAMPLVRNSPAVRDRLQQATTQMDASGMPMLPGSFPVAATIITRYQRAVIPIVCYRSYWGLHAYDLKNRKLHWITPMDGSIEKMLSTTATFSAADSWVNWFVSQAKRPNILFENSTIGSLSSDGTLVFAVDDLAVPPSLDRDWVGVGGPRGRPNPNVNDKLREAILHSRLRAYAMADGKLRWEVGGIDKDNKKDELHDSYFLGPPLPLGDRLYVLTEKKQEFRLVTLSALTGRLLAVQTLIISPRNLALDPMRRIEAVHLACGDGVLVCPTNASSILGIDLATGSLRWACAYQNHAVRFLGFSLTPFGSTWKSSAPFIREGKVVFTAPDADAVNCINVQDGTLLWRHPRQEGDAYCAGIFGGKVLIVGAKTVRAVSLDKGETLWKLDTGMPSGRGTFGQGGLYYLPLASAQDKKPAVAVIDMKKGVVAALVRSPKQEVPGNLMFFDDLLVSQTATEIVVYPLVK